jgi:glycosyltransferase involved in cell wall biosynthesis
VLSLVSVVVPVFSNADTLPELIDRIEKVEIDLDKLDVSLQIIFVNDSSIDNSLEILVRFSHRKNNVKVIDLARNFGGIAASKAGWEYVQGDAFITLAADLQEPPELIIDMVKEWKLGNKLVICERENRDDNKIDKTLSSLFYKLVRKYIVRDYPSGGFDLALLDSRYKEYLINSSKSTYPAFLIWSLGLNPKVIKYTRMARRGGKSGWTLLKKINAAIGIVSTFSTKPLRFAIIFGTGISTLSFIYGFSVIIFSLLKTIPVPGFATIICLITFMLGTIIIILGIIGEYLLKMSIELDKRPTFVIKEVY